MKRSSPGRKVQSDATESRGEHHDSGPRRSRTRYTTTGALPPVSTSRSKSAGVTASERAYGSLTPSRSRFRAGPRSHDPDAIASASERGFGGFGAFRPMGWGRSGASRDVEPEPADEAAAEILEVGKRRGDDDYNARLAALAEEMEGRTEAEQFALIQEVMRLDEGAADSWLQLDRLEGLASETVPGPRGPTPNPNQVDQSLLDAVEENMLFTAEGMEQYLEGEAKRNLEAYQDSSRDLRWFIQNHGVSMTPDGLHSAIEEFKNGRGDEWNDKLDSTQAQVVADGERILGMFDDPRMQALSEEQRRALMQSMVDPDNPAGTAVLSMTFNQDGGVAPRLLDDAMSFFAETGLREESPALATVVANARVQQVSRSIAEIDPNDPESIAAARSEIDRLDDADYAELSGIGDKTEELRATVAALKDAVKPGATPEEIAKSLEAFGEKADALDCDSESTTEGLRLLALQAGSVSLGDGEGAYDQVSGYIDAVGLGLDSSALLIKATGGQATALTKIFLGDAAGNVFAVIGAIQALHSLAEGDVLGAGMTLAPVIVGLMATNPLAGAAVGLAMVGLQLAIDQWNKVQASNEYMNDEAQAFLEHSGLDAEHANSLTDQSGEGYSPVPFLFAYAESRGLDREQTVEWLNSLDVNDLDWLRDRVHHTADAVNGDVSKVGNQAAFENPWSTEPMSWNELDDLINSRGIKLPGNSCPAT